MKVELVESVDEALGDWQALYRADGVATPFVSPGWARAWIRHWAPDARPWLLRVRDDQQVVALAPLVKGRRGPARMLKMLGKEPGDYWDILARPNVREPALKAVAAELVRRRHEWDGFVVSCLAPDSGFVPALAEAGLRVLERPAVPCPGIALPSTFDAYLGTLPGGHRSNLRRHLRRLDDGEVELREVRDPAELPRTIADWQDLRTRQWRAFGKSLTAEHASQRFYDFMLEALGDLVPAGRALVSEFRSAGRVVGVYVNLIDSHTFYWYLGGFDPAVAKLGVGKIAIGESIRSSIEQGRRYYDFTRGAEAYKYWYGAVDRQVPSLVVGNSAGRSRAAVTAARIISARRDRKPPA
jgi:CelD/BcsL family acetyltransferase involved in cellulose biosynthesis